MTRTRALACMSVLTVIALSGCMTPPPRVDYSVYEAEDPKSIVIVPVLNNSPEIGAEEYFLGTIARPLAERGYYVFPVHMTRELLAGAGLSDPGLVHQADPVRIGRLFGADAVLYVAINHWEAKYLLLTTTVVVAFDYALKSGRTGAELWAKSAQVTYSPPPPNTGNGIADLVIMVTQAAATKAAPNYVPLARQSNWAVVSAINAGQGSVDMPLANPLLFGPYHPLYRSDWVSGVAAPNPVAAPEESAKPAAVARPIKTTESAEGSSP